METQQRSIRVKKNMRSLTAKIQGIDLSEMTPTRTALYDVRSQKAAMKNAMKACFKDAQSLTGHARIHALRVCRTSTARGIDTNNRRGQYRSPAEIRREVNDGILDTFSDALQASNDAAEDTCGRGGLRYKLVLKKFLGAFHPVASFGVGRDVLKEGWRTPP